MDKFLESISREQAQKLVKVIEQTLSGMTDQDIGISIVLSEKNNGKPGVNYITNLPEDITAEYMTAVAAKILINGSDITFN